MQSIDFTVCDWGEVSFLFFSENVWGNFIYYSHFFPALSGLMLGTLLLYNFPKNKTVITLFFLTLFFSMWSMLDLVLWSSNKPDVIMFTWSIMIHFELLIYVTTFYFAFTYLNKKLPPLAIHLTVFILFLPVILFAHTKLNVLAFDFTNCWRDAVEGPLWRYYVPFVQFIAVISLITLSAITLYKITDRRRQYEVILFTTTLLFFHIFFSAGNLFGSLIENWEIGQFGLFGMPVLIFLLTAMFVKYNSYNLKSFLNEILVFSMGLLLLSQLFVQTIENSRIITIITLALFMFLGIILIKSVRKEIIQREKIEKLAKDLEKTNERLKIIDKQKSEFVSIASHQLRSPLTAIRGYVSMIQEGTFGEVSERLKEPLKRIEESGRFMATSIDDFLNVSRIESGSMKYEYAQVNLVDIAEHIVADLQADAAKRELLLLYKTNLIHKHTTIYADAGKVQQILHNLINNALKYTIKGTVTVYVHDDPATMIMYVDIIDTGIGMSQETLTKLFGKFSRAKIASSANIMGTGLGLFVAREMARAMKGDVVARSDGEGKGSVFTFMMPYEVSAAEVETKVRE